MLLHYSKNIGRQIVDIAYYNFKSILLFVITSVFAVVQHSMDGIYHWTGLDLPVVPVTIVGGALAIFLGFRNNSAYDRWWEARKIWGGIVNTSRSFSSLILTFPVEKDDIYSWQAGMVRRQIGWLYALKSHLRKQPDDEKIAEFISREEFEAIITKTNKPVHLLHLHSQQLSEAFKGGMLDSYKHVKLAELVTELYTLQGMAERIKNTVFPFYYNYFTKVFLWVFILCLPFALAPLMGFMAIPMSIMISFIFYILDKSGGVTEDPFEGRAADTPMSTITRSIEIDLLEMLGQEAPEPMQVKETRFGASYLD